MSLPSAIFFDWDGTLVDTIDMLFDAQNHVRDVMELPRWSIEDFYKNLKHSSLELYPRLYGDKSEQALKILYAYVEDNHLAQLNVLTYARELLEWIVGQGSRVGVVSNKKHKYLLREIEYLGWSDYIDVALGAGEASEDKPAAAPLIKAAEMIGVDHTEIFYVGDTVTDLLAAKNTGCRAVFITNGEDKSALIEEYSPFYVANDCEHLQNLLNDSIQHGSSENIIKSNA